jgi:hypothetical protein
MISYRVQLREIRLATDGTDDVALFDVTREEDGETWIVPVLLSPLFRLVRMSASASADSRQDMVAGLGARAIVEQLRHGAEPSQVESLLFTLDYPGAPGEPEPLPFYEEATIEVEESPSN